MLPAGPVNRHTKLEPKEMKLPNRTPRPAEDSGLINVLQRSPLCCAVDMPTYSTS
jgi:hypothetical protein